MASLYELDSHIYDVIQRGFSLDEETGEFWDDEAFEALDVERTAKLEACALFTKNLLADVEAMKAEERRLAERRRVLENKAERMREYIARSMQTFGDPKLETARVALSFRKSEAVQIVDELALPAEFVQVVETIKADKTALKKALKEGQDVPGAVLEVRQNLQIK